MRIGARRRRSRRSGRALPELFLVGAGGFSREAAAAVFAVNAFAPTWRVRGFLDDSPSLHGATVLGLPVIGPIDAAHDHPDARIVVCTGRPDNYVSRKMIVHRLEIDDTRYATVVHPAATIGAGCEVGPGSVLLANVDLTAEVSVGRHVAIMPQVVLTHDVVIEDFATLNSGVRVGGGCHIAEGAYVASSVCLREGITIGARAMVGMGSIVTRDVPCERLWYGLPAKDISRAPLPRSGPGAPTLNGSLAEAVSG